jgi:acyl-CoA synthetase (AMP-forming)/AMP-acid ligase II
VRIRSSPGAAVTLYLNDSFLSSAKTAATNGRFVFTIDDSVKSASYYIRLNEMAFNSGTLRSRAEVPPSRTPAHHWFGCGCKPFAPKARIRPSSLAPTGRSCRASTVPSDDGSVSATVALRSRPPPVSHGNSTAGRSEGVMLSHGNLMANVLNALGEGLWPGNSVYLHAVPMFHLANGTAMYFRVAVRRLQCRDPAL